MRRIFAAALPLCLIVLSSVQADARPRHHRVAAYHGAERIVCDDRGCSDPGQRTAPGRRNAMPAPSIGAGFGSLASRARQHIGATAAQLGLRRNLWCAAFMNMITGGGTGSDMARSFAGYGRPAPRGCVDCIAVLTRRGGGHVGVVSGYDGNGNPIIISGNHGHRVGESVYPIGRVIAWRYVS